MPSKEERNDYWEQDTRTRHPKERGEEGDSLPFLSPGKLLLVAAEAEITVGVFNPQEFLTGVLGVVNIMAG